MNLLKVKTGGKTNGRNFQWTDTSIANSPYFRKIQYRAKLPKCATLGQRIPQTVFLTDRRSSKASPGLTCKNLFWDGAFSKVGAI